MDIIFFEHESHGYLFKLRFTGVYYNYGLYGFYGFFFFTYNGHTLVPKDASHLKNGDINLSWIGFVENLCLEFVS